MRRLLSKMINRRVKPKVVKRDRTSRKIIRSYESLVDLLKTVKILRIGLYFDKEKPFFGRRLRREKGWEIL